MENIPGLFLNPVLIRAIPQAFLQNSVTAVAKSPRSSNLCCECCQSHPRALWACPTEAQTCQDPAGSETPQHCSAPSFPTQSPDPAASHGPRLGSCSFSLQQPPLGRGKPRESTGGCSGRVTSRTGWREPCSAPLECHPTSAPGTSRSRICSRCLTLSLHPACSQTLTPAGQREPRSFSSHSEGLWASPLAPTLTTPLLLHERGRRRKYSGCHTGLNPRETSSGVLGGIQEGFDGPSASAAGTEKGLFPLHSY